MSTLRVVTWNVLHTNRHQRVGLLAAAVATRRPDVVLLQESNPRHAEDLAAELGMHVAAVPDDAADLVSVPAVLSTREPSEVRVDCLAGDDGRNYYLTTAVLEVDSTRIRVGSTHLRHTPSAWQMTETGRRFARDSGIRIDFGAIEATTAVRLRQLAEIGDLLHRKMEPVDHEILGGDFNLVPPTAPSTPRSSRTGFGTAGTAPPRPPGRRCSPGTHWSATRPRTSVRTARRRGRSTTPSTTSSIRPEWKWFAPR
ncbi:endonuclease/exonuclease/phosphatase family protein [Rhodococcus sp. W8901]|uniref:endonuclease/exonuclease/phosphatase family protein n=1 Tax=Rhodococcus sp. W8901 TaxID=2742603 RepID=UPI0015815791|nr:endonuclease/exonuclease/phosphatase family protein [Rhodococcus sp. W8901]QKT10694.1 hypothetical protein HUN07_08150 [Rhodococcus sp. W8901]